MPLVRMVPWLSVTFYFASERAGVLPELGFVPAKALTRRKVYQLVRRMMPDAGRGADAATGSRPRNTNIPVWKEAPRSVRRSGSTYLPPLVLKTSFPSSFDAAVVDSYASTSALGSQEMEIITPFTLISLVFQFVFNAQ